MRRRVISAPYASDNPPKKTKGGSGMPEDVSFGKLYKKLLDNNFEPDPDRSGDALRAILRRLSSDSSAPS